MKEMSSVDVTKFWELVHDFQYNFTRMINFSHFTNHKDLLISIHPKNGSDFLTKFLNEDFEKDKTIEFIITPSSRERSGILRTMQLIEYQYEQLLEFNISELPSKDYEKFITTQVYEFVFKM